MNAAANLPPAYGPASLAQVEAIDNDYQATVDRARRVGVEKLSDEDVLTVVFTDRAVARLALAMGGSVQGLARTTVGTLSTPAGEGGPRLFENDAVALHAALELSRRARATPLSRTMPISHSRDAVRAFGPRLVESGEEEVLVVALDARRRPVGETVVARGGADGAMVTPGQVIRHVIRAGGSSFLVLHNHPSGDPMPSDEDIAFTRALSAAGDTVEVQLLDHVIVASGGTFSFLDTGLLKTETP